MIGDLPLSHAGVTTGETKALKKPLVRLRVKLSRNVSSRTVGRENVFYPAPTATATATATTTATVSGSQQT
jgi:hypothetical protein